MLVWTQQATNFHDRKRNSQAEGKEVDLAKQSKTIDEDLSNLVLW